MKRPVRARMKHPPWWQSAGKPRLEIVVHAVGRVSLDVHETEQGWFYGGVEGRDLHRLLKSLAARLGYDVKRKRKEGSPK